MQQWIRIHPSNLEAWSWGYKTNFMLKSHEHEVLCLERRRAIPAILLPMSLKNAPSASLRVHLENLLIFSLFITISVFSVT